MTLQANVPQTNALQRIVRNPDVKGGKPTIRGLRVTVGTVVGLLAAGNSEERILEAYPTLEPEDIRAALVYAVLAPAGRSTAQRLAATPTAPFDGSAR